MCGEDARGWGRRRRHPREPHSSWEAPAARARHSSWHTMGPWAHPKATRWPPTHSQYPDLPPSTGLPQGVSLSEPVQVRPALQCARPEPPVLRGGVQGPHVLRRRSVDALRRQEGDHAVLVQVGDVLGEGLVLAGIVADEDGGLAGDVLDGDGGEAAHPRCDERLQLGEAVEAAAGAGLDGAVGGVVGGGAGEEEGDEQQQRPRIARISALREPMSDGSSLL